MISPDGLAIKPLIPANCFICAAEPLAPLSAIINTEFILRPSFVISVADILFIISAATLSVHLDQASTTLLYFSPLVINPSEYCVSYSEINFFVSSINCCLFSGITKSSFPNEIPALKACLKPKSFNLSQNITVDFCPENLKT